jgi:hypothetical protein
MKKTRKLPFFLTGLGITVVVVLALSTGSGRLPVWAGSGSPTNPPPCDFNDAFYRAHGINPDALTERAGNADRNPLHFTPDPNCSRRDPTRRDFRILETTGGFNNAGNLLYYSIMETMPSPAVFTNDAAGAQARQIADSSRAFIFPKTARNADCSPGTVILSPAPPNRRQDNIFDTTGGYLSNNPLGTWILAFVVYTKAAFVQTPSGCQMGPRLQDLAARNGTDLDGSGIVISQSDVDGLVADGLAEIRTRDPLGSQGFRWVV